MKQETMMMIGFMAVLLFLAISLLFSTGKSCDVYIDYDVTVDSNETSKAPNIAEVKLACFKLCIEELRTNSLLDDCLEKCEDLE